MVLSWEEFKKSKQKEFGTEIKVVLPPSPRYDEIKQPEVKRFNIHKRSLPIGIDTVVVFAVTRQEAEWWIERRLKTKCYENGPDESKTLIYYDIVPVGATPKERSIYYNPRPVVTEEEN